MLSVSFHGRCGRGKPGIVEEAQAQGAGDNGAEVQAEDPPTLSEWGSFDTLEPVATGGVEVDPVQVMADKLAQKTSRGSALSLQTPTSGSFSRVFGR